MNLKKFFLTLLIILFIGFSAIGGYVIANWMITGEPAEFVKTISPVMMEDKNVLILGTNNEKSTSDVMMLACFDADSKCIDLISVLRDTRV